MHTQLYDALGVGICESLEVGDVREENVGSENFDGEVGESEVGEVLKVGEGDDEDVAEALDSGEDAKRGGELGREASEGDGGSEGTVEEE